MQTASTPEDVDRTVLEYFQRRLQRTSTVFPTEWELVVQRSSKLRRLSESKELENYLIEMFPETVLSKNKNVKLFEQLFSAAQDKGRERVMEALKQHQRLVLQLDRSDGRSDLKPQYIAEKYRNLFSICFRTGGAAWTAAFNALQFSGLLMQNYFYQKNDDFILDLDELCSDCSKRLLEYSPDSNQEKDEQHMFIQDMMLGVTRVMLRALLFHKELLQNIQCDRKVTNLVVKFGNFPPFFPKEALETVLTLDFQPFMKFEVEDSSKQKGESVDVYKVAVESADLWISNNSLN